MSEGRKGRLFPDRRKRHRDAQSGRAVWQLTNSSGRTSETLYFTNRTTTGDSRWLIYVSDRGVESDGFDHYGRPDGFDLYRMDLQTGESVQLTESGKVIKYTPDIDHHGTAVYYVEAGEHGETVRKVELDTLREREVCRLEGKVRRALSLRADDQAAIVAVDFESPRKSTTGQQDRGYAYSAIAIRSGLVVVSLDDGHSRYLINGMAPMAHVAYSPTDPKLVLYSIHGPWERVQRPWIINEDGSGNRAILRQHQGEGIGHEIWGDSGQSVYATSFNGRQPGGLWAASLDGTNERCVLAGAVIAHGCVNPEEDRFVVDELCGETSALWIAQAGSSVPTMLCRMSHDWFETGTTGRREATRHHPHPRFLPSGAGLTFNSGGEIFLVEV